VGSLSRRPIGTVEWRAYEQGLDFALIEIDPDLHDLVDPSMRHWGGPTGVATPDDTTTSDALYHYGNGVYYRESELLRSRVSGLVDHGTDTYCAEAAAYGGDSGILTADGKALGFNARRGPDCTPPTSLEGPTIPRVLDQAERQAGLDPDVVTAPLNDPVDREIQRVHHLP
jgi:hypothetical protein